MKTVTETGLGSFSMYKVTEYLGISETLIYRYFGTKEKLLSECYETVREKMVQLFQSELLTIIHKWEGKDAKELLYILWMTFFAYQVKNGYRTLFYFEYRESVLLHPPAGGRSEKAEADYQEFVECFQEFSRIYPVPEEIQAECLWIYIMDVTGIFAKRIIRGELPDTGESYDNVWRLISQGTLGLLRD